MNALYFLIGSLALLIALLFFSFIVLLWGLKQLLTIGNQNDTIISLLQQVSMGIWNEAHIQARLQEDNRDYAEAYDRFYGGQDSEKTSQTEIMQQP